MIVTGDPTQIDLPRVRNPASSRRCICSTASRVSTSRAFPTRTWCAMHWSAASFGPMKGQLPSKTRRADPAPHPARNRLRRRIRRLARWPRRDRHHGGSRGPQTVESQGRRRRRTLLRPSGRCGAARTQPAMAADRQAHQRPQLPADRALFAGRRHPRRHHPGARNPRTRGRRSRQEFHRSLHPSGGAWLSAHSGL